MRYSEWAPMYERIRSSFGYPLERERASADRLVELRPGLRADAALDAVAARIADRTAVVVGRAPGAGAPPLWRLPAADRPALVAADEATQTCLRSGLVPDVVVTDLDGPVASEVEAAARGSIAILHAHGDNAPALDEWARAFDGSVGGSWAGAPTAQLLDVGGFTDGDRGVFLAEHVGARRILLWGFDFDRPAEEGDAGSMKRRKLEWARESLTFLAASTTVPISWWRRDGTIVRYEVGVTIQ